jgi:filamentous hemagglutinin family protein
MTLLFCADDNVSYLSSTGNFQKIVYTLSIGLKYQEIVMRMSRIVNIVLLISFIHWDLAVAVPVGGRVVAGDASISQQGNQTQITQNSQNAVINWHSFNTNPLEQVNFIQPNAQSIALNRITSGLPTQFQGILTANGQVWIVNPAGVFFSKTSKIDAAGILATTLDIKNNNFMNGSYHFQFQPGFTNTTVINEGEINTVGDHGLVALMAPGVANNGIIRANAGKVVLASGTDMTLDFYGDNLINFAAGSQVTETPIGPEGKPLNNAVSNNGIIQANNGGQVLLTANAAEKVVQNVVSMTGVIEAKNAVQTNSGVIILGGSAGTTYVSGKTTSNHVKIKGHKTVVNGEINTTTNGFLETSGDYLDISNAKLNFGTGSSWLIDPEEIDIVIAGPCVGTCLLQSTLQTTLNGGTDVTVQTNPVPAGSGDINVDASITWTGGARLTMIAANDININQPISQTGSIGSILTLSAGNQININTGTISMAGTQNYNSPVVLSADANLTADGFVFISTINGGQNLTMTGDFVNFVGEIGGITPLSSLTLNERAINLYTSPVDAGLSLQVATTGDQTYNFITSPDGMYVGAASVEFISSGGTVTFNNPLRANTGVQDIQVTGNAAFLQAVGDDGAPLNSLTVTGQTTLATSDVTTTGNQDYQGAVILSNSSTNLIGSLIKFSNTLNGASDLTIIGNAEFAGNVGNTSSLNSLSVSGTTSIGGTAMTTTGAQTYSGPVQLVNGVFPTNLTGSLITFNNTLNGPNDFTITGNAQFNGDVGMSSFLQSLNVTGQTALNASNVRTFGDQNYQGAVTLGNSVTLTELNSGNQLNFGSTVQGAGLSLNATASNIFFNGDVGSSIDPLGDLNFSSVIAGIGSLQFFGSVNAQSLTTQNFGMSILNADINTTADQTYNNSVVIGSPLLNLAGGNIIFNNTLSSVDGTQGLSITSSISTQFNDDVGNGGGIFTMPLSSLTVTSPVISINADNVVTNGAQIYNGPITLQNTPSTLTGSDVTITNGLSGLSFLSINAIVTTLNGPFSIGGVTVTGTGINNSLGVDTGNPQTWNITGIDSGGITGIGGFNNIQNLVGGTAADTFIFSDATKITGSIIGRSANDILDFSGYTPIHPVSVIMSNVTTGSGSAFGNLIGNQIDTGSPITSFGGIDTVRGNGLGFFQVPPDKTNEIVIDSIINQISPTQIVVNGHVPDPIIFENFILLLPQNNIFLDVSTAVEGFETAVTTSSGCLGESCESSDIIVITDTPSESKPAGRVSCMIGFATAVDSMGRERIVLPGDEIYADEKIQKSSGGCIKVHYNKGYLGAIAGTSQSCSGEQ